MLTQLCDITKKTPKRKRRNYGILPFNMPLVSIVIANYNYGRFLAEAIESVLAQ